MLTCIRTGPAAGERRRLVMGTSPYPSDGKPARSSGDAQLRSCTKARSTSDCQRCNPIQPNEPRQMLKERCAWVSRRRHHDGFRRLSHRFHHARQCCFRPEALHHVTTRYHAWRRAVHRAQARSTLEQATLRPRCHWRFGKRNPGVRFWRVRWRCSTSSCCTEHGQSDPQDQDDGDAEVQFKQQKAVNS